jgi:methylated-DNA-[protein]-cysteine S-methyltransferase
MKTHRENDIIALLLDDITPSTRTTRWLGTLEGRRLLASYRRSLAAFDRFAALRGKAHGRARSDTAVYYTVMGSPIGRVLAAITDSGLVRVAFRRAEASFVAELRQTYGANVSKSGVRLAPVVQELSGYFSGRRQRFDLEVDLRQLTPFQRRVLSATRRVPSGHVVSYGDIARRIGQPMASRAVGQALGRNPVPIVIPCHRVIAGGGRIGGYTGGLAVKKKLLAIEGLRVA